MRLIRSIAVAMAAPALLLAACGGPDGANPQAAMTPPAEGDNALIASAQTISETLGGCTKPDAASAGSRVVGLEDGSIVMLACGQHAEGSTHRLFLARSDAGLQLLTLPDYNAGGWYATDQASMAEIDAGTGTLTTFRKGSEDGCGSEGRYIWDGARFTLQELRWKDCASENLTGPPFPVIWPTQQGVVVDPNGATPAP